MAVSRLKSWLESAKVLEYRSLNTNEILNAFHLIYPEKYAAHSQISLIDFIKKSISLAIDDDFLQPASQLAYVLIAFVAGIGFYHDQLIMDTLKEHVNALSIESNQDTRYQILSNAANDYLTNIIISARALATERDKD